MTNKTGTPTSLARGERLPFETRKQRLIETMQEHVTAKTAVDMSLPSHQEITEALHVLVYQPGPAAVLPVKYEDGAGPGAIPVRCLSAQQGPKAINEKTLRIGTLTFRHLDYDDHVDRYLIRDRETRPLSAAEIDALAHQRMTEVLLDPYLGNQRDFTIEIYQTGLEPLVVGLYRAVVEHLCVRRRQGLPLLAVRSFYFLDGRPGPLWC